DLAWCPIERAVEGTFRKGLFRGTLSARFEVLEDRGHVRVPVLDSGASLGEVLLNGQRTSLLREGTLYTLGVEAPGTYAVRVEFFYGKEQDRFERRIRFRLPDAGPTQVKALVPEQDIEPTLAHGALVVRRQGPEGTRLEGYLDPTGQLDLAWTRRLTHREEQDVRLEADLHALVTLQEALVTGLAVFDFQVQEGETARIELRLPADMEVLGVDGDAVLQWQTDPTDGGRLTVLLRYLVQEQVRLAVRFQFPATAGKPVELRLPMPTGETPVRGAVGVLGPAGLNVQVAEVQGAEQLEQRDLPPELTELTASPLLFGFRFTAAPTIRLAVKRHDEVQLTSTLIDELQASSVLIEDGTEITKLKLRIRNNTRQYLTLRLPPGAVLTHSLVDGRPIRPATTAADGGPALLLPLRQSERVGATGQRDHTVREGETLSDLANFYYSDPSQYRNILEANPDQLGDASDLMAGQQLRIPAAQGVTVEESSFVVELAYKRAGGEALGWFGRRELVLPTMDVDTMKATWHLYLPESIDPLGFDANLTQYSAIRYDPFRRLRDYLLQVLWVHDAWAGGKYRSILVQRKEIYKSDYARRTSGEVVLATFPLVGERYRFRRSLLGQEQPRILVTYAVRGLAGPVRWGVFGLAFAVGLFLFWRPRRAAAWLAAGGGLLLALLVAHFVLGVHRRVLWGVDLALLVALLHLRWRPWWEGLKGLAREPWRALELCTLRNLAFLVGLSALLWLALWFPLMLSSLTAVAAFLWWRRKARLAARQEVAHA
ncbi:MAG TPA: LysM peptidoglycan-binding domain-containing protein, partial [Myxococcota bacterium]|nr:LysM peptidoglycan-binding domain-containing protein [Myxococcota bacterium]